MAHERVPGLERDGEELSGRELAAIEEMAQRIYAEDPKYADRISRLGGYALHPLGLPSRWTALPVAIIGALLAVGVIVGAVFMDGSKVDSAVPMSQVHTK